MNTYCAVIKKNTENENLTVRKALFLARKNLLLLKIKISTILMITLKSIKLLKYFYWLETNLCQNCI